MGKSENRINQLLGQFRNVLLAAVKRHPNDFESALGEFENFWKAGRKSVKGVQKQLEYDIALETFKRELLKQGEASGPAKDKQQDIQQAES